MMMRAFAVWLVIVLVAIINGAIRQALIGPRTGDTLLLALLVSTEGSTVLLLPSLAIDKRTAARGLDILARSL
jgi:hypothetical protein